MAMFPAVQKRAREEILSVVGRDRLPSFEDRDRLPYVEAVCKEVMRYHAVVPNGERFYEYIKPQHLHKTTLI